MRCRHCQERILIKAPDDTSSILSSVKSVDAGFGNSDSEKSRMLQQLEELQQQSNSSASNPGMMKVSLWRHFLAYPKWALIWHLGLLFSIGLSVISLLFVPFVLFFLWAIRMYWKRVRSQFIAGCVNPGVILSVDPPLVAVHTDLRHADQPFPVIKVSREPLHRMLNVVPQEGQRVATVSLYESCTEEVEHWADFHPKVAACVASNSDDPQRLLDSIDADSWRELKEGLDQIPEPFEPGLYRIYPAEVQAREFTLEPDQIAELIDRCLSAARNCRLMSQGRMVPHEAFCYIPREVRKDILAVIESAEVSANVSQGVSLTTTGMFYHFHQMGKGAFRWEKVIGAFATRQGLEVTFADMRRITFPSSHFLNATRYALETLIDTIGRG